MKKTLTILTIFFALAAAFFITAACAERHNAYAADVDSSTDAEAVENIREELESEVDKNLSGIINSELENYFAELDKGSLSVGNSFRELIESVLSGENPLTPDTVLHAIAEAVTGSLSGILLTMITIVVLSLLGGLGESLSSGFAKSGTSQLIYWSVYGGIVVTLGFAINGVITDARETINGIASLINYTFPVFVTLLTALGGTGGVSVLAPVTLMINGAVSGIILSVVMPLFYATVVFTVVGNMSDNVRLGKLTKALKSVGGWILGITFGVITTVVAIQGIVGAGMDTIVLKSAKFALSSYIPILGGYLSEGFDLVLASCILIKNAFGLAVFAILLTIIVAPLVKILLLSLSLKLVAGLIEPVSDSKISELLYSTASNLNLLLSACAGMAFIVFIILLLVIGAFNAGVV